MKFPGIILTTFNNHTLLCRYCAKLPSDTFTRLTPKWKIIEDTSGPATQYQCLLKLPINSPVKKSIEVRH